MTFEKASRWGDSGKRRLKGLPSSSPSYGFTTGVVNTASKINPTKDLHQGRCRSISFVPQELKSLVRTSRGPFIQGVLSLSSHRTGASLQSSSSVAFKGFLLICEAVVSVCIIPFGDTPLLSVLFCT
ncbi:hypothetical protein MG293_014923 [Ovis ammon polii]|uniref:Uncharacterized protein n=1 Tax=Ovis ammon polii TaxID=230172 RepID=A0AAD4TTC8_OVIAM|nr:hypothetical protein MG293_014923 [Ovis ammon polii]